MHTIFIVEDHPVMRQQYTAFIDRESTLEICGEATSVQDALAKIPVHAPDIVIIDISLDGDQDGIQLVRILRAQDPTLRLLVVSGHEDPLYARLIFKAGANGYVVKGQPELFIQTIHQVLDTGTHGESPAQANLQER